MTRKPYRAILFTAIILILVTAGCGKPTATPVIQAATPTPGSLPLAKPDSELPAAGICATFSTDTVLITLDTYISAPRCVKVTPNQTLAIYNNTQKNLDVSFAGVLQTEMAPGTRAAIDTPFGEYLAPGVHDLKVSPCCGAEIWLEEQK